MHRNPGKKKVKWNLDLGTLFSQRPLTGAAVFSGAGALIAFITLYAVHLDSASSLIFLCIALFGIVAPWYWAIGLRRLDKKIAQLGKAKQLPKRSPLKK
jgi:hypothetical protein